MAKRKNGEIEFNFEGSEALQMPEENGEYAVAEDTTATDGGTATEDTYEEPSSEAAEDNNIHNNNEEEASMEDNNSTMITETTAADGSNEYKFQVNDDDKAVKSAIERAIEDKDKAGSVSSSGSSSTNNSLGFIPADLNEKFEKMRHRVSLYAADDAFKKMAPNISTEKAMLALWKQGYIAVEESDAQGWFEAFFQMSFLGWASQDALRIANDVQYIVGNYGVGFYPSLPCIVGNTMINMIKQYGDDVVDDKEGIIKAIESQMSVQEIKLPDRIKWEPGKIWLVLLTPKEKKNFKASGDQLTDDRQWLFKRFNGYIKAAEKNEAVTELATTEPTAENHDGQPAEGGTAEIPAEAWGNNS